MRVVINKRCMTEPGRLKSKGLAPRTGAQFKDTEMRAFFIAWYF